MRADGTGYLTGQWNLSIQFLPEGKREVQVIVTHIASINQACASCYYYGYTFQLLENWSMYREYGVRIFVPVIAVRLQIAGLFRIGPEDDDDSPGDGDCNTHHDLSTG